MLEWLTLTADDVISTHRELTQESSDKQDSDNNEEIFVPTFKGSANCIRGFSMDYIVH